MHWNDRLTGRGPGNLTKIFKWNRIVRFDAQSEIISQTLLKQKHLNRNRNSFFWWIFLLNASAIHANNSFNVCLPTQSNLRQLPIFSSAEVLFILTFLTENRFARAWMPNFHPDEAAFCSSPPLLLGEIKTRRKCEITPLRPMSHWISDSGFYRLSSKRRMKQHKSWEGKRPLPWTWDMTEKWFMS